MSCAMAGCGNGAPYDNANFCARHTLRADGSCECGAGALEYCADGERVPMVDPSQGLGPGGKKNDAGKPRWDLLPRRVLGGIVSVLTYGARTYDADSWQQVPNGLRRYLAAQERHLDDRLRGELNDKESGLLHAWHFGCNALFVTYKLAFCPEEVAAYAKASGYDSDSSVDV
jgi:hypothetical protein